jgi:prepilin-type N-terminal cleavage/methylation domain-containing protein
MRQNKGMSFLEIVVAILIIGIIAGGVGSLFFVAMEQARRNKISLAASSLAQDLMEEIDSKEWEDPSVSGNMGPEASESRYGNNSATIFDDIDDYRGWSKTPPEVRHPDPANTSGVSMDGQTIDLGGGKTYEVPDHSHFQRRVDVQYADPNTLQPQGLTASDYKIIIVSVDYSATDDFASPDYSFSFELIRSDY